MTRGHEASIALARELLQPGAAMKPVQVVAKDKRPVPAIDGFCAFELNSNCSGGVGLPRQLGLLQTSGFGLFEVKDPPLLADAMSARAPACQRETLATIAWSREAAVVDGPPRTLAVLMVDCMLTCSRSGLAPESATQLLVYREDGRLDLIVAEGRATTLGWRDDVLESAEVRAVWGDDSGVLRLASATAEK